MYTFPHLGVNSICVQEFGRRGRTNGSLLTSSAPGPSPTNTSSACDYPGQIQLFCGRMPAAAVTITQVLADLFQVSTPRTGGELQIGSRNVRKSAGNGSAVKTSWTRSADACTERPPGRAGTPPELPNSCCRGRWSEAGRPPERLRRRQPRSRWHLDRCRQSYGC